MVTYGTQPVSYPITGARLSLLQRGCLYSYGKIEFLILLLNTFQQYYNHLQQTILSITGWCLERSNSITYINYTKDTHEPGQLSQYSVWQQTRLTTLNSRQGQDIPLHQHVQNNSGAFTPNGYLSRFQA